MITFEKKTIIINDEFIQHYFKYSLKLFLYTVSKNLYERLLYKSN